MTDDRTTEELVCLAKEGDQAARNEVILRVINLVLKIARPTNQFRETWYEATMAIIKAIDGFDPTRGMKFTTYVGNNGHFIRWDHKRRRRTEEEQRLRFAMRETRPVAPESYEPPGERCSCLSDSINSALDERERFVVLMRLTTTLSYRQIGATMGVSYSRAQQIFIQAVEKLRDPAIQWCSECRAEPSSLS